MPRLVTLFLFCILFTTRIRNVAIASRFDPDRLRIIDTYAENVLVRGNVPLNNKGEFDASMILKVILENNQLVGDSKSFSKLIVVTLLSSRSKDEAVVLREIRHGITTTTTTSSPVLAELIHNPVAGSWLSLVVPSWVVPVVVDTTGGAWELTTTLYNLLRSEQTSSTSGGATAIYVHCMRGMDRTGLVAGIYSMRYLEYSLEEAQQANWGVAQRRLQFLEERSLEAAASSAIRSRRQSQYVQSQARPGGEL